MKTEAKVVKMVAPVKVTDKATKSYKEAAIRQIKNALDLVKADVFLFF